MSGVSVKFLAQTHIAPIQEMEFVCTFVQNADLLSPLMRADALQCAHFVLGVNIAVQSQEISAACNI